MTMNSSRAMSLELTEEQRMYDSVLQAFGFWNDVLYQLCDSAYHMRAIGEERQAEALLIDAESMARRARMHLKNLAARERAKSEVES